MHPAPAVVGGFHAFLEYSLGPKKTIVLFSNVSRIGLHFHNVANQQPRTRGRA